MTQIDRNLHTLSICYRILGGISGLVVTLWALIFFGGIFLGNGSISLLGAAFLLFVVLVGVTAVVVAFEVAGSLPKHESRTFCLVVAWLICALFPLGTVLGVLTILQLIQPDAERAFSEAGQPRATIEDSGAPAASPSS